MKPLLLILTSILLAGCFPHYRFKYVPIAKHTPASYVQKELDKKNPTLFVLADRSTGKRYFITNVATDDANIYLDTVAYEDDLLEIDYYKKAYERKRKTKMGIVKITPADRAFRKQLRDQSHIYIDSLPISTNGRFAIPNDSVKVIHDLDKKRMIWAILIPIWILVVAFGLLVIFFIQNFSIGGS